MNHVTARHWLAAFAACQLGAARHPRAHSDGRTLTMPKGIRVTVTDLETGDSESQEIQDDYVIACAGSCHVAHVNDYPKVGTHVVTVKGRKA